MTQSEKREPFAMPKMEIPEGMKEMAEAGVEQARKAFEQFMTTAQKTASQFEDRGAAAQANAKELTGKAISFAETNIRTSLDHAERLLKAKDVPEMLKLHSEHLQEQMRLLATQASELGRAAMDAAKPK